MSNIEEFANIFVQTFITKIKEEKLDINEIEYWGFFGDPCVHKQRRIGIYGYIDFKGNLTIGSSLDECMHKFNYNFKANNYIKYIEDNIIVIANKIFKDFLSKSIDKQLVFNFAKEENEDEVIVHNS